jgi:DNA-binding NtrC family response regulator
MAAQPLLGGNAVDRELKQLELDELRARVRRLETELTEKHRAESLNLHELERQAVQAALQQAQGNKVHAARALGISRRALYRLIQKYRLEESSSGGVERPNPGGLGV